MYRVSHTTGRFNLPSGVVPSQGIQLIRTVTWRRIRSRDDTPSSLAPALATDLIAKPPMRLLHVVHHLVLPGKRLASILFASGTFQC